MAGIGTQRLAIRVNDDRMAFAQTNVAHSNRLNTPQTKRISSLCMHTRKLGCMPHQHALQKGGCMHLPRLKPADSNSLSPVEPSRTQKPAPNLFVSVNVIPDYCTSQDSRAANPRSRPQHAVRSRLCGADHPRASETLLANLSPRMDRFRSAKTGLGRGLSLAGRGGGRDGRRP
jgi:hypothetical protein